MSREVFVEAAPPAGSAAAAEAVERLLQKLPSQSLPAPGMRVLLKPNLLAGHPPEKAVSTHPDVVRGVILALQKRGVHKITLADSPGGPYTPSLMAGVYKTSGLAAVCAETGVELYTACKSRAVPCEGKLVRRFELIEPVLEADYIINLPKLKTHVLTGMSGAVKNLFGCVPGLQKAEFHMRFPEKEAFGQMLVDLCEQVKPGLHLVDGILGMEGDGPAGGTVRKAGLLLASEDPYSLDLALCRYMGMAPAGVPTLAAALQNGLCAEVFDEALLVGEEAARRPLAGFVLPASHTGGVDFSDKLPRFMRGAAPFFRRLLAPRPVVRKKACIGCGKCAGICPKKVIVMEGAKAHIQPEHCIRCFCCHEMCPVKAIRVHKMPLFRL